MKKTALLLVLVFSIFHTCYSQVNMVWNNFFDVAWPGKEHISAIDSTGNIYLVYSTDNFALDTFKIRKYNNQGTLMWDQMIKIVNGPADWINTVYCIIDDQQNVVIAADVWMSGGISNAYLDKFNSQGTNVWKDSITNIDYIYGIKAGASGSFYIQYDSSTSNYGVNIRHIQSSGAIIYDSNIDHLSGGNIIALDNNNNLWFNTIVVTSTEDTSKYYKLDAAGNLVDSLIIPVSSWGPMSFDSQNNIYVCYNLTYPTNSNYYDSVKAGFRKYDAGMNLIWDTGPTELYRVTQMYLNSSGDLYAYGENAGGSAAVAQEARLGRVDASGNLSWVNKFGISLSGKTTYMWSHLLPDSNGNPVLTGGYYPPGYGTTFDTDIFYVRTTDSSGAITSYEEFFQQDIYSRVNSSKIINNQLFMLTEGLSAALYQLCLSCTPTLTGTVYYDSDSSCTKSTQEPGIPSGVFVQPGSTFLYTDSLGNYKAHLTDNNYQVIFPALYNYPGTCNTDTISVSIIGGVPVNQVDNGKYLNPSINDLKIESGHGFIRPGFNCEYSVRYTNIGGSNQNGDIEFIADSNLTFLQSVPPPTLITGDTLQWTFANLGVLEHDDIHITFKVDSLVPIGSYLVNNINGNGISPDANPNDNILIDSSFVTGSFDPNDKSVSPVGIGPQGFVTASDTAFNYTIRFENTGNDTAFMVTILDILDADLDIATFTPGLSSHNYDWSVINGNTIRFRFVNIYLPDTSHPNENKGYVCFSIRQKQGLQPGTVISNTAQIYFDFNAAVITNTTINTIFNPLSINEISESSFRLFPNPANNKITVSSNKPISKLIIYNIYGQTVKIVTPDNSVNENILNEIDISDLSSGVYFVDMFDGEKSYCRKFVVQQD